jgi:hypothetical protein
MSVNVVVNDAVWAAALLFDVMAPIVRVESTVKDDVSWILPTVAVTVHIPAV